MALGGQGCLPKRTPRTGGVWQWHEKNGVMRWQHRRGGRRWCRGVGGEGVEEAFPLDGVVVVGGGGWCW
ncbi:MAG: hypothetical protein CML73_03580 [Rhodobiaceae bacterium]|nr:hypothetical protein [Rhodobiaceae bacterium]